MEVFLLPVKTLVITWVLGAGFTKLLIPKLEEKQFRQFVRDEGPKSHHKKTGTPSMGGLAIIAATWVGALAVAIFSHGVTAELIAVLVAMVLFDIKLIHQNKEAQMKREPKETEKEQDTKMEERSINLRTR